MRPAIFLDRDGTIIEDVHYLRDPADVRLLPGAASAMKRLQDAGYALVVVTNQSAIGRGMLTHEGLAAVHDVLTDALAEHGVTLDGYEYCPVAPKEIDPLAPEHPDRKPGPGMLLRAARELDLDLSHSWMIGDALSDAMAGRNAGCHGTVLVRTGRRTVPAEHDAIDHVVDDLPAAADTVLAEERRAPVAGRTDGAAIASRAGRRFRVAVCFDLYAPLDEHKEGNLILGLREAGADAFLVTRGKPELDGHEPPYEMRCARAEELVTPAFWTALDVDAVLAYTFLNWHYTPLVRAIKAAGRPLLVRADTDGRIGHPVQPRRMVLDPPWTPEGVRNVARRAAWWLAPGKMSRLRLDHLDVPDAIFIESPGALANVEAFVTHWGRPDLLDKFTLVPMTISDAFVDAPLVEKTKQIVLVGRWVDERQKNTRVAVRALEAFLATRPDHRAVMVGRGEDVIRSHLADPRVVGDRLLIAGVVSQEEVMGHVGPSRILFMPSNWEGFALAAGEAMCIGCSIAATPIGSLEFLTQDGRYGTIATGFGETAVLDALIAEASSWDRGDRDPAEIAAMWRPRINRRAVGAALVNLLESIVEAT